MPDPPRSADYLVELILTTPGLLDQVKKSPDKTLKILAKQTTKQLLPPAMITDPWIYRIVVSSLGIVAVATILGAILLSSKGSGSAPIPIPDVLTALGAAAIGALAGLLAPSPTSS